MLISTNSWRALIEAGIGAVPLDPQRVVLRRDGQQATVRVHVFPTPVTPSNVAALVSRQAEPGLVIVPAATPAVRAAIEAAGWSWLVDDGQQVIGALRIAGQRIELDRPDRRVGRASRQRRPGRVPWGALTLVRRLIERPYATQREMADLVRVSQPRVSQALQVLVSGRLVERGEAGWRVRDFGQTVRWWLDAYPGPGGFSTYWYGLSPLLEQLNSVVTVLDSAAFPVQRSADRPRAVLSGDVAADLIAPWRNPERLVVYARAGVDLTAVGLVPAAAEDATLEFVVPEDPGVWPVLSADLTRDGVPLPLADPLQILWDVRRASGPDTDEAVARLEQELLRRSQRGHGGSAA
ncbi:MarR family transcriptional regulator [Plantactinospora solaniradicis]|uniref:MarR family transcriptional regulator n=1 Tax=Plantactinospora solaniradicis TaxID=1723736 RepID=A0ABW1K0H8_9ACTN